MISLHIKVKPGSFKDEITFDAEGTLTVKIREKPIDGAANDYLIKYLAKQFKLNKSCVSLEKGSTSKYKTINLHLTEQEWEVLKGSLRKSEV